MIKYVTVLSRRAGLSREEFSNYWRNTHAPILREIRGLMGYVHNRALHLKGGSHGDRLKNVQFRRYHDQEDH
jgi:uncharacterized protein (TIGR02118 family)